VGVAEKVTNSAVCYGECLQSQGTLGTDKRFTGQRLDNTGLYYYGARYYDPTIGRFISADSIVQSYSNPQSLNRYSYVFNNPLKYVDPSGSIVEIQYENNVSAYISGMMQYGIVGGTGSYMDQMFQEFSTYQQVWNDIKQEMPVEAKAMEQAKETYFIGSSTTLEIYTPQSKLIYPATRSTTQIEGLPNINTGYEDTNITIPTPFGVALTGGVISYRQGKGIVIYPYVGFGVAGLGVSITGSMDAVSTSGNVAIQGSLYGVTGQYGYSIDESGVSRFIEYGLAWPPRGYSLTAFGTSHKFVWHPPWFR
jgi:RHS repeat-associated protein